MSNFCPSASPSDVLSTSRFRDKTFSVVFRTTPFLMVSRVQEHDKGKTASQSTKRGSDDWKAYRRTPFGKFALHVFIYNDDKGFLLSYLYVLSVHNGIMFIRIEPSRDYSAVRPTEGSLRNIVIIFHHLLRMHHIILQTYGVQKRTNSAVVVMVVWTINWGFYQKAEDYKNHWLFLLNNAPWN